MGNESNKQTAVEWLMEEMSKTYIFNQDDFDMFKQAKEMDKKQRLQDMILMQCIKVVDIYGDVTFMFKPIEYFEQKYGKTFIDLVSDEESKVHEVVRKLKEKRIK